MKTIDIPLVEALDSLSDAVVINALMRSGSQGVVDELNWPKGYPHKPECRFFIARGSECLAVLFKVKGPDLRAANLEDGGMVCQDSTCEFFLQTSDEGYYNFEMNCIGTMLVGFGPGRHNRVPMSAADMARIRRITTLEHQKMDIRGGAYEWSIAMVIPYSLIGLDADNLPESLPANFYKCGDLTAHEHYLTWNPVETEQPDYHRPEFFGEVRFRSL